MNFGYVWMIWSSAFLLPWVALWLRAASYRSTMWRASLATAPFGLTEPLFVPEYWNPPSLFDLAQRTGFDIESLIFCFAIGGVGAVLYNIVSRRYLTALPAAEHGPMRHRWHRLALLTPIVTFLLLNWLPWNPIYAGITAMTLGAIAAAVCRPDLAEKTFVGGLLFLVYYGVFMLALLWSAPGYVDQVWNLPALTGIRLAGIPLEELLYGFAFGMYWTGVYEHISWRSARNVTTPASTADGKQQDVNMRSLQRSGRANRKRGVCDRKVLTQVSASGCGLWSLVIINSLVFIIFAFSFAKPQSKRDWRSFSAFSAFLVAFFTCEFQSLPDEVVQVESG